MSRRSLFLFCVALVLCMLSLSTVTPSGVLLASAQGSASASSSSKTCSIFTWLPTPAPALGNDVVYPKNSVAYVRHEYPLPPKTFFIAHWYVGIIIIVALVCGAYILLGMWVCYHFECCDQRRAKKVVKESYVTKGYFDIDRYVDRGSGAEQQQNAAEMEERNMRSRGRNFVPSSSFDGGSYDGSYSDDDDSVSNDSASDEDEGVVQVNPLRR